MVKFNNEQVIFKALILLKTEFQNKYALNWYHNDQVISSTHKQGQQPFVHELLDELKVEWAQTTQIEVNGIGLGTAEVVEEFKQSWQTTIR